MADSVQKNFRMSQKSIKLLHSVARALGVTETEVVETCVSKFALEIGQDVERAKELLFQQICGAAANSPVLQSRGEPELPGSALNEGSGRGARQAGGLHAVETAAGALAITAAESAGRKHGASKKK
jgi:hypothetical protein